MKKPACFLLFLLLAVPAFAQNQEFGIFLGGVKRLYSGHDKEAAQAQNNKAGIDVTLPIDRFRLTSGAREVYYAVQIEPATWFRIQGGQWSTDVGVVQSGLQLSKPGHPPIEGTDTKFPTSGTIQHVDGIVDYRFSEPYGTTGLFGGLGLYRWSASNPSGNPVYDVPTETNYGYVVGLHGQFPMTKRYAVMVEGAYHWINMSSPVRYVSVMGGVRMAF